jgi:hypothetical protein
MNTEIQYITHLLVKNDLLAYILTINLILNP